MSPNEDRVAELEVLTELLRDENLLLQEKLEEAEITAHAIRVFDAGPSEN